MKKYFFRFCAALFFLFGCMIQVSGVDSIPSTIHLAYGQNRSFALHLPVQLKEQENVVSFAGSAEDKSKVEIVPNQQGETTVNVSLLGIPLKQVKVNVHGSRTVIPGGQSIGVALYTKGALVVGMGSIQDVNGNSVNPAKQSGLLSGDIIERVNGILINDAQHVMDILGRLSSGDTVTLDIVRGGDKQQVQITPVQDGSDGQFRMGIWVRDSMAGVGTMSFYDPSAMQFASLGHAIYDTDTKTMLNLKSGQIVETEIFGIKQGKQGNPGELKGSFDGSKESLGTISMNNDFGIYGNISRMPNNGLYQEAIPTALIPEVKTGPAKILSTIGGDGVKEYDVEIEKLSDQQSPSTKSMVVKVTDNELLEKTGGIVQGMSGSPIIQNGKLIGAVTHVFINDPTRGYGLYAQWMLEQMN